MIHEIDLWYTGNPIEAPMRFNTKTQRYIFPDDSTMSKSDFETINVETSTVLEWRFSFNQAVIDYLTEQARKVVA